MTCQKTGKMRTSGTWYPRPVQMKNNYRYFLCISMINMVELFLRNGSHSSSLGSELGNLLNHHCSLSFLSCCQKIKALNYKENHLTDIRKYDPEDGSHGKRMSKYVGKLEASNIPYDISWSILLRAPTYSPITKSCRLCLLEKYFIMFDSAGATLNVKSEFFSTCLHKQKLL